MSLFSAGKTGGPKFSTGKSIDNTSFAGRNVNVKFGMVQGTGTALKGAKMGDKSGAPNQGGGKKGK